MSVLNTGRFPGGPGARRRLRAAIALGTVSIFGAVCIPAANAEPSTIPASTVVSTPAAEVNSDADIAALEQLKATYFTDVDAKNWAGLRTLFAPDAVVDTRSSFGPIFYSRDPFIIFTALTLELLSTHHVGSDPQITVTSPTTAEGVWQLEDHLNVGNLIGILGYAHYSDTYEKVGDTWVVATSTLHRTRLDVVILPGLANISFTVFDVNSENPLIKAISRALQNFVDPTGATAATAATSATSATSTTAALATSAPALTADAPAALARPSVAKKVTTLGAPKAANITGEGQAKPVTTVAPGTQDTEATHQTEATDQTEETSSGSDDSSGSSDTTKPERADHIKGVQAPDSTTQSASGPNDSNSSSNATKPKQADRVAGAAEPKKAAKEAKAT
jgi:hypothetical protein